MDPILPHVIALVAALAPGTTIPEPLQAILSLLNAPKMAPHPAVPVAVQERDDRLLTVHEAAVILGTSVDWLYRNSKKLPFTRRVSRKQLRFSERGIQKYIARRGSGRGL